MLLPVGRGWLLADGECEKEWEHGWELEAERAEG
jgi:hypothetical protein